jgi:hypothetical protein
VKILFGLMLDIEQINKLKQGLALFNQGEYFDSHEFFEELWQEAENEIQRQQFLFFVRVAAASVHLSNSNFSCLFLFQLAYKQLLDGLKFEYLDLDQNLNLNSNQDSNSFSQSSFCISTERLRNDVEKLVFKLANSSRENLANIAKERFFSIQIDS